MGNSVLVVSGYFKQDTTAADKMMKVLEAESAAGQKTVLYSLSWSMEKAVMPESVTSISFKKTRAFA